MKSKDGEDFGRLKNLGFSFESSQNEFSQQPDSGSTTGGKIGIQEYGINGGIATLDIVEDSDPLEGLEELEFQSDPTPESALSRDDNLEAQGGISEWSLKNGVQEEKVIENLDTESTNKNQKPK